MAYKLHVRDVGSASSNRKFVSNNEGRSNSATNKLQDYSDPGIHVQTCGLQLWSIGSLRETLPDGKIWYTEKSMRDTPGRGKNSKCMSKLCMNKYEHILLYITMSSKTHDEPYIQKVSRKCCSFHDYSSRSSFKTQVGTEFTRHRNLGFHSWQLGKVKMLRRCGTQA